MIYSVDGRGEKGNDVPICQQGHPEASEYIDHREKRENRREERREKRREKEKKISKIQQEPDTNTDYSRGYELANSTYSNALALYTPQTATSCTGAAESNHASRFPGNFCGRGSLTSATWIVLSPSSESKEAIEAAEEMEEAGD